MSFIKYHWFGLLSGLTIFVFMTLFILVLLSPRQDADNRGFIPCTQRLAEQLLVCKDGSKMSCLFKAIVQNTWCDMKVVGHGFVNWTKGKQSAPWSNYIFDAKLSEISELDTETEAEYLQNNLAPKIEMRDLINLSEELENEIIREEIDENEKPQ